jgi:hypothetical protein
LIINIPSIANKEVTEVRSNFGSHPFKHSVEATPLADLTSYQSSPGESGSILNETATESKDKSPTEEELLHLALEKNILRFVTYGEDEKSWSQFPPSVYKRSLSATRIQRVWRIYRGRKWRKHLLSLRFRAALLIQRVAKRKLTRIRSTKNKAALTVQRYWRITLYLRVSLLRKF